MLHFCQAVVLGIVEGITEFLPISSTAHLILAADLLHLAQTAFMKSFEVIIQFGAILAVLFLYWHSFLKWGVLKRLAVAFLPTGILGLIFYKLIKTYLLSSESIVLWTLFLGGIGLIIFEKMHREKETALDDVSKISYRKCLAIGLFQSVAMVPGVSRSAATIIGGLILGMKRRTILEFSFLLAVPTMLAATGLDLFRSAGDFSLDQVHFLIVGFITSFVAAVIGIKFLLSYVRKKSFLIFGIYRVVAVILFLL